MNTTPEIVNICIEKAKKIIVLENQINSEYSKLIATGKPLQETLSNNRCTAWKAIEKQQELFSEMIIKVADLYPAYLKKIPKVHLPICKR